MTLCGRPAGLPHFLFPASPRERHAKVTEPVFGLYFPSLFRCYEGMKLTELHIGMNVRHPQYGMGVVKTLSEHTADVQFLDGLRTVAPETSGLQSAVAQASLSGLEIPLESLLEKMASALMDKMGVERPDAVVDQLATRWHNGKLVLASSDPSLQPKEVPMEAFFHKIVMMRNNLRVLEQKINAHDKLSDAEKVEMQQYITRCYGSMTTFNVLFKSKEGQFSGTAS